MLPIKPQQPLNLISPFLFLNLAVGNSTAQHRTDKRSSAKSGKQTTQELFTIQWLCCVMFHHKRSYRTNNNTKALFDLDVYPDRSSSHLASESILTDLNLWSDFDSRIHLNTFWRETETADLKTLFLYYKTQQSYKTSKLKKCQNESEERSEKSDILEVFHTKLTCHCGHVYICLTYHLWMWSAKCAWGAFTLSAFLTRCILVPTQQAV